MRVLGVILVVAGLLGLAVGSLQYTRTKDVLNIGSVHVETNERKAVAIPPLFAGAVAAIGVLLFLATKKTGK
jgi:hypothetical protein